MSKVDAEMERLALGIVEVQLVLRDRFTPVIRVTAHQLHVFSFEMSPWWKRWWHIVRGCPWAKQA